MRSYNPIHCWSRLAFTALTLTLTPADVNAQLPANGYTVTNLDTLGGLTSFALDINDVGQITGNAQLPVGQPAPRLNAFLWESGGPMQNLGVLPGSNNFSRGYAINDLGQVVGESDNNSSRAFLHTPGSGMTNLGGLQGLNASGIAHGINNDGTIVGASSNGSAVRAFVRNTSGVMRDIGTLDGLTTTSARAWSVSNSGYITGISSTAVTGIRHAFLFRDANGNNQTDAGELIDLDAGIGDPNAFSEAFAVNDFGAAVGQAAVGTTPGGTIIVNPFLWENGTRTNLGTLGRTFGQARDINNAGIVVGNVSNISGLADAAFVWTALTGTVNLNTMIPVNSGWTLRTAEGINSQGQIIGYGTFGGNSTAFLLTPVVSAAAPEPMTLALLASLGGPIALLASSRYRNLRKQDKDRAS